MFFVAADGVDFCEMTLNGQLPGEYDIDLDPTGATGVAAWRSVPRNLAAVRVGNRSTVRAFGDLLVSQVDFQNSGIRNDGCAVEGFVVERSSFENCGDQFIQTGSGKAYELSTMGAMHFVATKREPGDSLYGNSYGYQVVGNTFSVGSYTSFTRAALILDYGNFGAAENVDPRKYDLTYTYVGDDGIERKTRSSFVGNEIADYGSGDGLVKWALGHTRCQNFEVRGNLLRGGKSPHQSYRQVLHFEDGVSHIEISGNEFWSYSSVPYPVLQQGENTAVVVLASTDRLKPHHVRFEGNRFHGDVTGSAFAGPGGLDFPLFQGNVVGTPIDKFSLGQSLLSFGYVYATPDGAWDGGGNTFNGGSWDSGLLDISAVTPTGPKADRAAKQSELDALRADVTAEAPPTGLRLQVSGIDHYLTWDVSPEKDLMEYRVYSAPGPDAPFALLASELSVPYLHVRNASTNEDTRYQVTVVDLNGNESKPTAAVHR